MKTKILLMFMLSIGISVNAQSTFEKILGALSGVSASNATFKDVITQTVEVNSLMKFHGITRQSVQVKVPTGTTKLYYRVTVLPVTSTYAYQSNESLLYLLQNKKSMDIYSPTLADNDNINFYFIGHSGDLSSFLEGKSCNVLKGSHTNINSFVDVNETLIKEENLWIGIENPNKVHGLKVIIEVVALGAF